MGMSLRRYCLGKGSEKSRLAWSSAAVALQMVVNSYPHPLLGDIHTGCHYLVLVYVYVQ